MGEKMETVTDFIFLGSKITADGDCSHKIKRQLHLGRKAMTNLDSILKAETLLCQQRSVLSRLWFFQWSCMDVRVGLLKKAEHRRIDAFKLWCWRRLLRVPQTARRSNQSVLKEISPECSLERLMLKLNLPILWPLDLKSQLIGKDPGAGND